MPVLLATPSPKNVLKHCGTQRVEDTRQDETAVLRLTKEELSLPSKGKRSSAVLLHRRAPEDTVTGADAPPLPCSARHPQSLARFFQR